VRFVAAMQTLLKVRYGCNVIFVFIAIHSDSLFCPMIDISRYAVPLSIGYADFYKYNGYSVPLGE
jgi:hypothetical protein